MVLSIVCFKGSEINFPNKCVFQSLNIAFIKANSADPVVRMTWALIGHFWSIYMTTSCLTLPDKKQQQDNYIRNAQKGI